LVGQCAGVSVGIVGGEILLDLTYEEDFRAEVDMNLVINGAGEIIEIQGCAEHKSFSRSTMDAMLDLAQGGVHELMRIQDEVLGRA
jgi:ribonuclease PH